MSKQVILVIFVAVLVAACGRASNTLPGLAEETIESSPPTSTRVPASPTATSTPSPTPTRTPTVTPTSPPLGYGPKDFPDDVNPLTGKAVAGPEILQRRPVSVKVELYPRINRPQWGLSFADIVFEYDQNSYLTRFDAIFYGNDAELVGPVRSARLLDASLVRMYKSNFVFGLADQRILTRLINSDFADHLIWEGREVNCPPTVKVPLCRFDPSGRRLLLTNTEMITQYVIDKEIENEPQDLEGMYFHVNPPQGGQRAVQINNRYSISSYNQWEYDEKSGRYLRFQDANEDTGQGETYAPLTDRLNDQQIGAENVVILLVPHEYYWRSADGRQEILDILLSGSGPAYAFRDGQVYEVEWNRPALDSVLYLTFPDGTDYPFKPGITWFQIHGTSSTISPDEDEGIWRFEFRIP